jgi:hypothetical protein
MKRRKFFFSSAGISKAMFYPAFIPTPEGQIEDASSPDLVEKIKRLELFVRSHPHQFSWPVHNELRHFYAPVNEAKSMWHANLILAHSLMDDYIMSILGGWQLDKYPEQAVVALLDKAERHSSLVPLHAACLIKAGDMCRDCGNATDAVELYSSALTPNYAAETADDSLMRYQRLRHHRSLRQYQKLAQMRLSHTTASTSRSA